MIIIPTAVFSSGHDGGDWILDVFVNGQNVHLSANQLLDEVYGGSTYQFPPTAQATVNVPRNGYLINTLGTDVDGCDAKPQLIPSATASGPEAVRYWRSPWFG
ncbi:MAG TPA: hypothetical protein VFS97_00575 [Nitrososphaeraceae archaeon]|nr:hypothetical protein [Nitrososphaeraceae archaeon]